MTSANATLKRPLGSVLLTATVYGALALAGPVARADISETVDVPNAALSGFTGPYATVDIRANSSNSATITFTSLTTNGTTFLMGGAGAADLNVNGAYTLGTVTETGLTGFTPSFKNNTWGQPPMGGTPWMVGNFDLSLNNNDGYGSAAKSITINITNTTGLWTSDAAVLVNAAGGFNAAIHAFACTATCTPTRTALATGFAARRVPEPASMTLLGTGLAGLGFALGLRRRSRNSTAN